MEKLKNLWKADISAADKGPFIREITRENLNRLAWFVPLLVIIEICLYFIQDRLMGVGPLILSLLIAVAIWLPFFLVVRMNFERVALNFSRFVVLIFGILIIAFGASLAIYLSNRIDLMHVFMMTVIGVVSMLFYLPATNRMLLLVSYLAYVIALPFFSQDPNYIFVARINSAIFFIFTYALSRLILRFRYNAFCDHRNIYERNKCLEVLVKQDTMTGLLNHESVFLLLKEEIRRADDAYPLSVALLDIDGFKDINDRFGHLAGDDVIRQVAEILKRNIKGTDHAGRYGGEEFLLILPQADLEVSRSIVRRIMAELACYPFDLDIEVSISAGISQHHGESDDELIHLTDKKLYYAKNHGKNQICHNLAAGE